jgi:1-acyl-sn-glycerol-3-phosphate acyltransferase
MRAFLTIAAVAVIFLLLLPFQWLAVRFGWPSRRTIPVLFHRWVCRLLGARITILGRLCQERPLLIVANHSSWLDIPVISAVAPVAFVAKGEVAGWPVIGLLARLQRSVFVDRTKRHKTAEVNSEIARRLADGDPVVLFGEGTSSDGNRILPFRTALIGAAGDVFTAPGGASSPGGVKRVWIQPLSVAYTAILGVPLGRVTRHSVAWYGGTSLWPHLRWLVARGAIDVTVSFGEPIPYDESSDRKTVARQLEDKVRTLTIAALRGRQVA